MTGVNAPVSQLSMDESLLPRLTMAAYKLSELADEDFLDRPLHGIAQVRSYHTDHT